MIDALAAEWWKLRSVRSTFAVLGTVAAFALLCVVWSLYAAHYWDGLSQARRAMFEKLARHAYRYHGSQLVRTKVLTSSTLHGQAANLYATFDEAVRALEDDRARGR